MKVNDAAQMLENSVSKLMERMTQDLQGRLDAMERRHREEVEASDRKHKAEWTVMAEYFNRLEERVGVMEDYVKETSKEFIDSHVMQYHKMYAMDSRHSLRHDVAFNTLFRHMQGNEGVFDRWSNRLSRIEARLNLPVGTFEDYNPMRSGEYEQAVQIASSVGAETGDEELWERLVSAHERFDILKGKLRDGSPTPQPPRGDTPPPQPGPSHFPGNYQASSGDRMSVRGANSGAEDDAPATPRDELADSDEVEIVDGFRESPRKPQDDDEVEFVDPPASPSKAEPGDPSGDVQMLELDAALQPAAAATFAVAGPPQLLPPPWQAPQADPADIKQHVPAWPAPPAWPDLWPAPQAAIAPQVAPTPSEEPAVQVESAPHVDPAPQVEPSSQGEPVLATELAPQQENLSSAPPVIPDPLTATATPAPAGSPPSTSPRGPLIEPVGTPSEPPGPTDQPGPLLRPVSAVSPPAPPAQPDVPQSEAEEPPAAPLAKQLVSAPPPPPPTVNVIPPTPQNSQPDNEGVTAEVEPAAPPAPPPRGGREVEATRVLSEMWGADNSLMPPGPPATRTRGRSRANSAQPGAQNPMVGLRASKSAGQHTTRRTSKSPAPAAQTSSATPNPNPPA